ncbi:MAG: LytTR family DNA-binding domain-containing protein [Winogradskyella sp.]
MEQIRCLIVDDEPPALRLLTKYIESVPFLKLAASTNNPLEALKCIENEKIELVYLDIKMPEITGIQISKILKGKTKIIFTTAYPDFAVESYNLNALDYLLKPFTFERFYEASVKALKSDFKSVEAYDDQLYFFVKTGGKYNFEKIFLEDIYYVEGLKNYASIILENRKLVVYGTLQNILNCLPKNSFIQTHKSYIISLKHIDKVDSNSVFIDNACIPIGNTYRDTFFEKINELNLLNNSLNKGNSQSHE